MLTSHIYIDVTRTVRSGLHTGIQRVVRGLLDGFEGIAQVPVHPVLLDHPSMLQLDYLPPHPLEGKPSGPVQPQHCTPLEVCEGDILLMADASWYFDPWPAVERFQYAGGRLVGLVHDLLPLTRPEWFRPGLQACFLAHLQALLEHAEQLFVPSRHVLEQLRQYAPPSLSLHCLPHGSDLHRHAAACRALPPQLTGLGLAPGNYCLAVGTVEPRKNHASLITAFEALWASGERLQLVLIGSEGWCVESLTRRIRQHPQHGHLLHWLEHIDDPLLVSLYRHARATLYLSHDEGFGLPVLEARQLGCPVIATDIPVLRESGGDWPQYIPPDALPVQLPPALHQASARCAASTDPWSPPRDWCHVACELLEHLAPYP